MTRATLYSLIALGVIGSSVAAYGMKNRNIPVNMAKRMIRK
ncbi:hypothetical protein Back11_19110 [Paenibacillus baekrokdamisoli]|uniref:Uncharacterized protein n=1 Tax=Paenibacillus baekrokdamisoli TaxID=1712516 RepID=A0A3G9IQB7_9BACL|nr:hypothetical protein [Paenibacillus baekrokdamisoli]BBH20566.1 hypothetical protein Back11_19110 [Paenibacillus baekrokdamisoli]